MPIRVQIFLQVLCHLVGDYPLQSSWMANNKTKSWEVAAVHSFVYMIPFLLACEVLPLSLLAALVMFGTHVVIDRLRIAKYIAFASNFLSPRSEWKPWSECKGTGYHKDTPPFMAVWLMVIIDQILHLAINFLSLTYLS